MSAILYLFYTVPQTKYFSVSKLDPEVGFFCFSVSKLDSEVGLVLMWGLRRRAKRGFTNLTVIWPIFFQGPLNNYLQHVLQTIIYFMKMQSQNIYLENTPAPPPPPWNWNTTIPRKNGKSKRLKIISAFSDNKHVYIRFLYFSFDFKDYNLGYKRAVNLLD